jgi:hypothetical protein
MENGNNIFEKISRWKLLAQEFKEENKKIFIKDIECNIYFCYLTNLSEDKKIKINCVGPPQRANQEFELRWLEIKCFEEFKE